MATWKTYFQAVFKSKDGNVYAANLMKLTDTTPTVEQLTPAQNPLVTREDADDDVFTPIRSQSGYLRVVDESGGGLIERLMPPNNTTLMIRVYKGTYSGTWPNGTFTGDSSRMNIVWAGFVQSQIYTQPWTDYTSILELPIVSMLGSLKNIQIDTTQMQSRINVVYLARKAAAELSGRNHGYEIWEKFSFITDLGNYLIYYYFNVVMLQNKKEYVNDDGVTMTISEGITYYEALSRVVALFGITLREEGYRLYWSKLCASGLHIREVLNYDEDEGSFEDATTVTEVDLDDLVNYNNIQFSSTKNTRSLIPGRRNAIVEFRLNTDSALNLILPQAMEDESTVYEYQVACTRFTDFYFRIQPHATPSLSSTTYNIVLHNAETGATWENVFKSSVLYAPQKFPNPPSTAPEWDEMWSMSGALPIRFSYYESGGSYGNMAQAHLLTLFSCNSEDHNTRLTSADPALLSINSETSQSFADGYINIQMHIWPFYAAHVGVVGGWESSPVLYVDGGYSTTFTFKLKLIVRMGNYYYNGESWVQDSNARLVVTFDPSTIVSNYSTDFDVVDVGGFYIPIPSAMTGVVEVSICDYMDIGEGTYGEYYDFRTVILDEFLVQHIAPSSATVSERSENTYRRTIASAGYENDKNIALDFGTYNNNVAAINFVEKSTGARWTNDVPFKIYDSSISSGYSILNRRPEVQLLNAMQDYHKRVRSTYTGWIRRTADNAIDWMETLMAYNGCFFYGIIKQRNWRDGDEEIKLIETYNPEE